MAERSVGTGDGSDRPDVRLAPSAASVAGGLHFLFFINS